jgi:hypothetical protein
MRIGLQAFFKFRGDARLAEARLTLHDGSPVKPQNSASRRNAIRSVSAGDWTGIVRVAASAA